MQKREWKRCLAAILLVIAILVVSNPEIRAYLFVVDALGIDAFFLLLAIQISVFYAPLRARVGPMREFLCVAAFRACCAITRVTSTSLALRPFAVLVSPMLVVIPVTSRCLVRGSANQSLKLPLDN
jgi:hypothetical protein